ncbi:poly polymerase catalytic domain-containing protein [Powellomyces hirtus]|nr:poly polymerase catalytic domain-containing protein [Powellomyces hirtus]
MLNQTEIKNNNNKFYVIQVLKSDTSDVYYAWTRWGRVGAKGQMSGMNPTSKERAISEFHKKFHDKTRNQWEDRDNFEKVPGKYFLIEREFGDDPEDEDEDTKPADAKPIPPSKLAQPVQDLVKLIFNVEMMTQSMQEIGYDAKKLPLGKLTKANIKKGYNALAKISDELNKARPDRSRLTDFSSEFYTIIPHSFSGRQVPPVIDTAAALKSKLQMVEALGDIEIATEILKATENLLDQNPVDVHFKKLNTELVPVKKDTEVYSLVEKYMRNTHAETHRDYELDIEDLFEVARNGEENRAKNLHNRQLLWHGSRLTNYVGILSQGLKIAPPEAPVTGYMFGKGIYFADMVSKSANYCFTSNQSPTGILLLCEVALGDQWQATNAEYNAREISEKKGCHSTYGQGKTMPDPKQFETLPGSPDVIVPCGKPINSNVKGAYLLYNEFITYDIEKVKIRYGHRYTTRHETIRDFPLLPTALADEGSVPYYLDT